MMSRCEYLSPQVKRMVECSITEEAIGDELVRTGGYASLHRRVPKSAVGPATI